MKNERIKRRIGHTKLLKKRVERNERNKNIKKHEWNKGKKERDKNKALATISNLD